ncbi:broad-complex core protein isoform X4 [Athalia rosae]|uniref:broad-complex core protein isoform X4 n=1 Tax=Athalia rosae TaxID=37344 RepID=UPI0020335CE6|nr:broad-complex core protein isoform X4 [Athalia rosae]
MVDTQHFCLRWNNYQSSITSAFENLRDDEDFVDVTLACDGKSLKAHRVVLSACSPYFRELLKSTPCKHPVIVLQDVAFSDLHALVEFIYHGEVNVHQRSLSSFLKTAEVLRVSGLTQQSDQTDRDELSHVRALAAGNHVPSHEKLPDEGFPSGNSPPPTPATPVSTTMQQLFRRSQIRKSEAHTFEPHNENVKRPRLPSPPLNNNDATPTDFSMMKSNHLSSKIEGNGLNEDSSHIEENIKCEPLELTGGNGGAGGNHDDSSDSGAAASDRPPASASSNEHDPEPEHAPTPNFLTPESKLFTPGAYNFSMHALTDHSSMSGLGHGLQTPDLAGTSQGKRISQFDPEVLQTTVRLSGGNVKPKLEIFPVAGTSVHGNVNTLNPTGSGNNNYPQSFNNVLEKILHPDNNSVNAVTVFGNAAGASSSGVGSSLNSNVGEAATSGYFEGRNNLELTTAKNQNADAASASAGFIDNPNSFPTPSFDTLINPATVPFDVNFLPDTAPSDWFANVPPEFRNANTESMQGLPCTHCGKWLRNKITLKRHIQDLHCAQSEEFRCNICDKVYRTKNSLVVHNCNYHGNNKKIHHGKLFVGQGIQF